MTTLMTTSFARGSKTKTFGEDRPLRNRCEASEASFKNCLNRLMKIGQNKKATELFDKYVDLWI